jgi:hypothetical protein
MWSLRRALAATGRRLITMAGRLVVEVDWRCCCLKDWWKCCSLLELSQWDVLFSEARWNQRVDLAGSHLNLRRPAPIAGCIATYRTCRANTRTALLELNVLTVPSHLADWKSLSLYLCRCFVADPSVDTTRNNTWILKLIVCILLRIKYSKQCCVRRKPWTWPNTWIVAIVGYYGNPVYRTVVCIHICVGVISVAIW